MPAVDSPCAPCWPRCPCLFSCSPTLLPQPLASSLQVVIAFRGTASMANLRADLQVWRRRWPEGIGTPLLCR
jgi:hypothetical protein